MHQLATELAKLYPEPDNIRVVLSRAKLPLEKIARDPVPVTYWENILHFANGQQSLDSVVGAVLHDHRRDTEVGGQILRLADALKQAGDTTRINKRRVLVMMSFGGNDLLKQQIATLDYMRLKELLEEKVRVKTEAGHLTYSVSRLDDYFGPYVQRAIPKIAEADVMVAFVNEWTPNLTFEIALRWMVREELLLVIRRDQIDGIPIYLKTMGYITYEPVFRTPASGSKSYGKAKDSLAEAQRKEIEAADTKLTEDLDKALLALEAGHYPRSAEAVGLLPKYVSPSLFLSAWATFYPLSVVRCAWRGMTGHGHYLQDDMESPPAVCWGNDQFLGFYAVNRIPHAGLAGVQLLDRLKRLKYITQTVHDLLLADQARVGAEVFLHNRNMPANVPLIVHQHARSEFAGKSFLPVFVGRNTVGDPEGRHCTYLLVAYIDLPTMTLGNPTVT